VNAHFKGPADKLPPLIVMIHGGPTGQAKSTFQMKMQYWTSRGFAVLDVNYRGSTGYGRQYRSLLDKQWGVADVEDCINGVQWLISAGRVDPTKIAIRGGSAGGFTTLAALASSSLFTAGASYYGVADITALANDTHKFESKYMDLLVGKYPDEKHLWVARSPIHHVAKIKAPLAIFQGEDDTIVPKNQSVMIYDALKKQEVPVEIHLYPGEEHGFRRAENVIDSLEKERLFYLKVFGIF
jgi:dipeptidyl aminopeptidase/acylaminoacyl peptidase